MAIEPSHPAGESASDQEVASVLEHLASCAPFDVERTKGTWSKRLSHAATQLNLLGVALLISLALFAALLYGVGPAAAWLKGPLLVFGLVVLPVLGLGSLLCTIGADALHLAAMHKHQGRNLASAYWHDVLNVDTLQRFAPIALQSTDMWLEQKIKRMERRLTRFFGGSDKVAVLTLIAAGWASWKEIHRLAQGAEPPWLLLGLAFLGGISLGGLMVSQQLEKLAYQRDLLALAAKRRARLAALPPSPTETK